MIIASAGDCWAAINCWLQAAISRIMFSGSRLSAIDALVQGNISGFTYANRVVNLSRLSTTTRIVFHDERRDRFFSLSDMVVVGVLSIYYYTADNM